MYDETGINPKASQGRLKTEFHNIPASAFIPMERLDASYAIMKELAEAMNEGARKYGRFNWLDQKIEFKDYYNAFIRHYLQWAHESTIDEESGINHLSKIIAGMCVVLDADINNTLIYKDSDERIKYQEGYGFLSLISRLLDSYSREGLIECMAYIVKEREKDEV
jgi:hypothetical protein